jgi:hypothetical protein
MLIGASAQEQALKPIKRKRKEERNSCPLNKTVLDL